MSTVAYINTWDYSALIDSKWQQQLWRILIHSVKVIYHGEHNASIQLSFAKWYKIINIWL